MTNYTDVEAVYALNHYVWGLLQAKLGWQEVNGLIPVVPAQDQPELYNYDSPYIVYGYTVEGSDEMYLRQSEIVSYTVYGTNTQVVKALGMLNKALRRYDDSATDINYYTQANATGNLKNVTIQFTEVVQLTSPDAAVSEGGKLDGNIAVRYVYSRNTESDEFRL